MKNILVLFSHPHFEQSKVNSMLIDRIKDKPGVTVHDLYEEYPNFYIDVDAEKELLSKHDVIIWQYPFYWYSCPPLMKHWIESVLEYNWAYGPEGDALKSKICLNVITTGGSKDIYCTKGTCGYTVLEFLRPMEQTAKLCRMNYYPPFTVMGTFKLTDEELNNYAVQYEKLIEFLQKDIPDPSYKNAFYLNELPQLKADLV